MPVSVDLRVKVADSEALRRRLAALTKSSPEVLEQEDVYFNARRGRLMLRRENGQAELVFYMKPDVATPRVSAYFRKPVADPDAVEEDLALRLGYGQRVRKRRLVFHHGASRVNLDSVESLGDFVEIAVPLDDPRAVPRAHAIVRKLVRDLDLTNAMPVGSEYEALLSKQS